MVLVSSLCKGCRSLLLRPPLRLRPQPAAIAGLLCRRCGPDNLAHMNEAEISTIEAVRLVGEN